MVGLISLFLKYNLHQLYLGPTQHFFSVSGTGRLPLARRILSSSSPFQCNEGVPAFLSFKFERAQGHHGPELQRRVELLIVEDQASDERVHGLVEDPEEEDRRGVPQDAQLGDIQETG